MDIMFLIRKPMKVSTELMASTEAEEEVSRLFEQLLAKINNPEEKAGEDDNPPIMMLMLR